MASDSIHPVRESLREVAVDSWIIADRLFLSHQSFESPGCISWSDGHGGFFVLSEEKRPTLESLRPPRPISLVYDVGDAHAAWEIGDAFLKVTIAGRPDTTREHVTLEALHKMNLSFAIPDVLYHGEWNGRYYLVLSKMAGQTLSKAWPRMPETSRSQCVDRIASICNELAAKHGEKISGIDGHHLPEYYLASGRGPAIDFSPEAFLKNCQEVKMDCSAPFEFYHCDLGPGNIIVDFVGDQVVVSVIDWECAGFVPREWIRTKFCLCGGMDLTEGFADGSAEGSPTDWRARMQRKLGQEGYPELADTWMAWRGYV